jgi:hypothetical protein
MRGRELNKQNIREWDKNKRKQKKKEQTFFMLF